MGDDAFGCIADCAHARKLSNMEALFREMKWPCTDRWEATSWLSSLSTSPICVFHIELLLT